MTSLPPKTKSFQTYTITVVLLIVALICALPALTKGQTADDVVRTDVSVVQLNVGVVDGQGHAITSLSRNDFAVYEDGIKQSIQSFEPTYAPFSLVLLLDMSGSTLSFRQQLKQAAFRFLDALSPDDRVAVIQFNARSKTLIGFSQNRQRAAYAIEIAQGAGETYFFEALKHALAELNTEGNRRKAIVVLTDGLDTQMRNVDRAAAAKANTDEEALASIKPEASARLNSVLGDADRQGVTIYPLALPSGDPTRLPLQDPVITAIYGAARTRLQTLAVRTGGSLNEIHRLEQMARLFPEVAANLRTLYTVTYQAPGNRARDGKWHEVKVEVKYPNLVARTKPGYYAR